MPFRSKIAPIKAIFSEACIFQYNKSKIKNASRGLRYGTKEQIGVVSSNSDKNRRRR